MLDDRTEVAGCKIVHIKTIPTVGAGELSFLRQHMMFLFMLRGCTTFQRFQKELEEDSMLIRN